MILNDEQIEQLLEAAKPLIKYLNEFHPHVQVVVDSTSAEFFEASARVVTDEFLKD